ncbi:MAG: phosphatidylserine decarboxylase family protein [Gemmatimonadota bacterium]
MRIAPEGWPFIIGAWAIALLLGIFAPVWAIVLWVPIAIWVVAFFRDPIRSGPRGENVCIAPADGLVVSVVNVDEPDYVKGRTVRVSIFMNVFNVHVNRYPMSGRIEYRHYNKGRFGHAGTEKASLENEQSSIGLLTSQGKVLVRQIAGLVARRIVTDHDAGALAVQAERMGLIRFGSRVDIFLPVSATVLVHTGDKTQAGATVVAQWE